MQSCQEFFELQGTARELPGNKPLALDDPQSVWLVGSGRVDVFAIPRQGGEPTGSRIHLLRAEKGQLLLGGECGASEQPELVAVGVPGTKVIRLPRSGLSALVEDPVRSAQFGSLLDAWIDALTAGVARGWPRGQVSPLEASKDACFEADKNVSPAHDTLWVRNCSGTIQFLGRDDACFGAPDVCFPIAASGWFTTRQRVSLETVKTESLLGDAHLWTGLDHFHQLVLSCVTQNVRERAAAELDRLRRKAASEKGLLRASLSQLAAVVQPETAKVAVLAPDEDPLVAACRLVGQRADIAIRAPADFRDSKWVAPIAAVARASGVRSRRVLLAENWWRQDNGPLLAFQGEDKRPVALLPTSPSSYEVVDPADASRTPVSEANVSSLQTFGYCFYRSFAPRALSPRDVLAFGLAGTGRDWLAVILLGIAGGLLGMLIPIAIGLIFGDIIPNQHRDQLLFLALALGVSAVVMAVMQFSQGVAAVRAETRMDHAVEAGVWDRLLNLPTAFFRHYTAGDLALRAMGIARIRQAFTGAAMSTLHTFISSVVSFALLFYFDVRLAMLATVFFLFVVGVTCSAAYIQVGYERRGLHVSGKTAGIVLQLLTGISRLRVAGAENRALAFWSKSFSQQSKLFLRAQSVSNNLAAFTAAVPVLASVMIFSAVALFPSENLTLATFLAFNAAFAQIIFAAIMMSTALTSVLETVPLYERAKPIFTTLPEFHKAQRHPGELSGDIEISHASFRYHPDAPLVLDDACIHAKPGEFLALVGPSGAGKSTIFRLLLGFESLASGSIYFDREDLAGLDHQAVRRQIGVVLQNSRLTPGDILTNITGSSQFTVEDAWEAARLSGFDKEIEQMPMGMYTVVTEGESTLSGGQRQRLLIARAVVSKPKILLFDEATSALDNVTQAKVSESLERLKATRIVVAHRLSTVKNADRICVVDHGKVVQQGHYRELIEQPGLFAELAARQLL